jgi:hypothetical protein
MTDKEKLIDHMFKSACGYGMAEGNSRQSKFDEMAIICLIKQVELLKVVKKLLKSA